MQQLINNYFVVNVPENSYDFEISKFKHHCTLDFKQKDKDAIDGHITHFWNNVIEYDFLDKCTIIGLGDELTEEPWDEIVEHHIVERDNEDVKLYRRYPDEVYILGYSTDSGMSLLSSKNLNPKTSLILLKH